MMRVWFDMDGTLADLYNEEQWLEKILNNNAEPFVNAKAMVKEEVLKDLVKEGCILGIITWTPKNANKEFCKEVKRAKVEWLKRNYPNIKFDTIHCIKYGINKWYYRETNLDILVDDEQGNLNRWRGKAINAKELH